MTLSFANTVRLHSKRFLLAYKTQPIQTSAAKIMTILAYDFRSVGTCAVRMCGGEATVQEVEVFFAAKYNNLVVV